MGPESWVSCVIRFHLVWRRRNSCHYGNEVQASSNSANEITVMTATSTFRTNVHFKKITDFEIHPVHSSLVLCAAPPTGFSTSSMWQSPTVLQVTLEVWKKASPWKPPPCLLGLRGNQPQEPADVVTGVWSVDKCCLCHEGKRLPSGPCCVCGGFFMVLRNPSARCHYWAAIPL